MVLAICAVIFSLDWQALRVSVHHPGQFGNADHAAIRNVGHPGPPDDRRNVVLAMAFEANVPKHDHFVVPFDLLEGLFQNLSRILTVAREKLLERSGHASGRFDRAVSVQIFGGPSDDGSYRCFDFRSARPLGFRLRRSSVQHMHVRIHRYALLWPRSKRRLTLSRLDDP
jgi:hypothetical protein